MNILFKIVTQKPISIELTNEQILKYPVHEHYMIECIEKVVIYKFKPTRKTEANLEKYTEVLKRYLKRKYNAYSVTTGALQNQLNQPIKYPTN